jgi:hypothetical protein
VVLFTFSAVVSAVHVPYGTFIHSAVALVPHAYLLSMLGLAAVVRWVAVRRPSWDAGRATRNLSLMVVGVLVATSMLATVITVTGWRRERDNRADVLAALAAAARPDDVVMSPDAGAYRYQGGWRGIVTPEDPLPVIEQALRLYGVRWLTLERAHLVSAMAPVLTGEVRPDWLSAPLVVVAPPADGQATTSEEDSDVPVAALYAVCLTPDDTRCER